jgi:hypothetical protein
MNATTTHYAISRLGGVGAPTACFLAALTLFGPMACNETCHRTEPHSTNTGLASYAYPNGLAATSPLLALSVTTSWDREQLVVHAEGSFLDALGDYLVSSVSVSIIERASEQPLPPRTYLCVGAAPLPNNETQPVTDCRLAAGTLSVEQATHRCESYEDATVCRNWFKGHISAGWIDDSRSTNVELEIDEGGEWRDVVCLD